MAEGKKSFVAYADWKSIFDELPDEDAGKLIKHIFSYVNDENPTSENVLIRAVFAQIKATLKRDLIKWESQMEQRRNAGKASAEARKNAINDRSTTVNERQRNSTVSVSVSVNDSEKNKKFSLPNGNVFSFEDFWSLYPKKVEKVKCEKKYKAISEIDKQKIKDTLPYFLAYKQFDGYVHPNPLTYLNGKRWDDEIPTQKISSPSQSNQRMITKYPD